jgi:hypothetical protein
VAFDLPIEFSFFDRAGNKTIKKLHIDQPQQVFRLPVKTKIVKVEIDPHTSLLFSGIIKEMKN